MAAATASWRSSLSRMPKAARIASPPIGLRLVVERRVVGGVEGEGLLGGVLGHVDDQVDHRLHLLVAELDRAEHLGLGELVGLGLDHHHRVLGAGDDQVEPLLGVVAQLLHVVDGRVQHVGAVDEADARRADRAHERHARQGQRGGGGDHADDVGVVLHVVGEHGDDDLDLVLEALDEQRPDRAVDQARGQHLLLGRPRLALEEAAGDLAGGVGLLLVVDGQREEVLAGLRPSSRRRRWRARWSRRRWRRRRRRPGGRSCPVSSVSVSWPHSIDFLTTLNISLPSYRRRAPWPGAVQRGRLPADPVALGCGRSLGVGGARRTVGGFREGPALRPAPEATGRAATARPGRGQRRMPRRPISD